MSALRDASIRQKLIAAFGVTSFFAVAIAVLAAWMLTSVSDTTLEVNNKWLPGIRTMDAMHSQHSTIRRYALGYLLCEDEGCRHMYRTKMAEARGALTDGFNEFIGNYAVTQAEKDELIYLSHLVETDNKILDRILSDADAGHREEAEALVLSDSRMAYETAYSTGDKVITEYNRGAAAATQNALHVAHRSRVIILGAAVLILCLSFGATVLFTSFIARPVTEAAALLHQVADKDLTSTIEVRSNDEVGQLGASLNKTIQSFRKILTELSHSSDVLNQASREMREASLQTAENARSQSHKINQIAAAAQEMTATIGEISHNVETVAHASMESARLAENGGDVMKSASDTMAQIAESSSQIASKMSLLKQHSESIGSVVTVIQEISEQTNLLALNAAIESARAGEHGRGFAVVAGEVRRLAERTRNATEEISGMITSIQMETHETLEVVQGSHEAVVSGQNETDRAYKNLAEIISASRQVDEQIHLIATAATQQTAASREIAESAGVISTLSLDNAAGAEQTGDKLKELVSLASELDSVFEEFRLS